MKDLVDKINVVLTEMQAMSLQYGMMFGMNAAMDTRNVQGAQWPNIDKEKVGGNPTDGKADTSTLTKNEWTPSFFNLDTYDLQPLVGTIAPPFLPFVKENKPLVFHSLGSPLVSPGLEKMSPCYFEFPMVFAPMQSPFNVGMAFHSSGMNQIGALPCTTPPPL